MSRLLITAEIISVTVGTGISKGVWGAINEHFCEMHRKEFLFSNMCAELSRVIHIFNPCLTNFTGRLYIEFNRLECKFL